MAFNIKGFRTVDWMPNPSGAAGSNLNVHQYVTDDDTAAVITAGYFNSIWRRLKKGDHINMTLSLSGSVMRRDYIVTASSSSAVTIAAQNVA